MYRTRNLILSAMGALALLFLTAGPGAALPLAAPLDPAAAWQPLPDGDADAEGAPAGGEEAPVGGAEQPAQPAADADANAASPAASAAAPDIWDTGTPDCICIRALGPDGKLPVCCQQ